MPDAKSAFRVNPRMEALEDRCTPTVGIRFDYSLDTSGFFAAPDRRAALERAAADVSARLPDGLTAVTPNGGNSWTASTINGLTGQLVTIGNPTVNANELVVYVVGGTLSGSELGLASSGAYSAQGSADWLRTVRTRGQAGVDAGTDFASWGGMIAFRDSTNWNFADATPNASQFDFQSVATHELMHVLGFGLGNASFDRYTGSGAFAGPNVVAVNGSPVPMQAGAHSDHFAAGASYHGQEDPMQPSVRPGVRRRMTELDYAALRDIGWTGTAAPVPTTPPVPTTGGGSVAPVQATPPTGTRAAPPAGFAIGNGPTGTPAAYGYDANGQPVFNTSQLGANFAGGSRVAVGDFDGDGTADYAVGAGPGAQPEVKVFSGKDGHLMADFMAFEWYFQGGVYVAAGDVNGDGRDELIVGAGAGGGPRVKVIDLTTNQVLADFWGIADANFRGGARPAAGDINGDGKADLVVAAGEGGGPRVAIYDGRSVGNLQQPTRLVPDFYAFESTLTNGAYVAVGDIDGDGKADLICGSGEGGGPRVVVYDGAALSAGRIVQVASFMAGDGSGQSGVRVAAADVDGDGRADILTGPGPNSDGVVRAFSGLSALRSATPAVLKQFRSSDWAVNGAFVG